MTPLLSVRGLKTCLRTKRGNIWAVDGVSFDIGEKQTLGLVGESGCGKSTLARTLAHLIEPSDGQIILDGQDITALSNAKMKHVRPKIQMIFQDPYASLNPRKTIGQIIEVPLQVQRIGSRAERLDRVHWLMERVGLRPEFASRFPHEFSGGQRQRVGIARALSLQPKFIICDEPVSALDVSIRAQVLNLLMRLQDEFGFSYLFISHDLSVVRHVSDRVAVMYLGRIVEIGGNDEVWESPAHPYTQALIEAIPKIDRIGKRAMGKGVLPGDLPSPFSPPTGCRFHTRCVAARDLCASSEPVERKSADGHRVSCHFSNLVGEEVR